VIFHIHQGRRKEIRTQPAPFAAKSSGYSPGEAATHCLASIEAVLSCRRQSHLTPGIHHAGAGGDRNRAINERISCSNLGATNPGEHKGKAGKKCAEIDRASDGVANFADGRDRPPLDPARQMWQELPSGSTETHPCGAPVRFPALPSSRSAQCGRTLFEISYRCGFRLSTAVA
jgi:hypothetical protein